MPDDTRARNEYARMRTALANERTLLSYLRTGLGFSAAGASAFHFLSGSKSIALGTAGSAFGIGFLLFGAYRFLSVRASMGKVAEIPDSHGGV